MSEIKEQGRSVNNKNVIINYQGEVNECSFIHIMHLSERRLEKTEPKVKLRKKIFNILVEVLQNIFHYFQDYENDGMRHDVLVSLYKDSGEYHICTGNQIRNDKVGALKMILDKVNTLNREDLIDLYRSKLQSGSTGSRKAGLGILDIKRKAGTNVNYEFNLLNNEYSYFSLIVRVTA